MVCLTQRNVGPSPVVTRVAGRWHQPNTMSVGGPHYFISMVMGIEYNPISYQAFTLVCIVDKVSWQYSWQTPVTGKTPTLYSLPCILTPCFVLLLSSTSSMKSSYSLFPLISLCHSHLQILEVIYGQKIMKFQEIYACVGSLASHWYWIG